MRLLKLLSIFTMLATAGCYSIGDLGPAPFACVPSTQPECPDGYSCDNKSSYCEVPCPDGVTCPDSMTCNMNKFCVYPCKTGADCNVLVGFTGYICPASLGFCTPPGHS